MNNWLKRIQTWSLECTNAKWGPWILLLLGIADASFLPIPVTTLFVALSLLNSRKTLTYSIFLTLGIVAGATLGYMTGRFAWLDQHAGFTGLAQFFNNNLPGFSIESYQKIHILFTKWGTWILLLATGTPLPYGLFSISSGIFNINIFVFIFVTMAGHGIKYLFLAFLTKKMGASINRLIVFTWRPVTVIPVACLVIAIVVLKVV
jgi:membrane protein YqaA with SNARE-associated domain